MPLAHVSYSTQSEEVVIMPVLERIGVTGVTGSGKSYHWLKLAEILLPTGAVFRCLDTDNAIEFMLETQFPRLKPENGGNVLVHNVFSWPDYKLGVNWIQRNITKKEDLDKLSPYVRQDYARPLKPNDWTIVDMADMAWSTVQRYFVGEVFGEDMGEYFLAIRKEMEAGKRKPRAGGSTIAEGLDGWKDWSVINKLYDDWILPIIYRIHTHVYVTTKVERLDRSTKDAELLTLYGDLGVRLGGQKSLGHQMHSLFLLVPGKEDWEITTIKDRGGRPYFSKVKLRSLYVQYLAAKAGWPMV